MYTQEYGTDNTDQTIFKYDEFCAGVPADVDHDDDGNTDEGDSPCNLDEGNPLICPVDGKPMLYGVTSKVSCGQENAASVFTKTASLGLIILIISDKN